MHFFLVTFRHETTRSWVRGLHNLQLLMHNTPNALSLLVILPKYSYGGTQSH